MKRICKTFAVLLVMVIVLFSFSITAGATEVSNTQDGLVASITSEKDSYKANEDIELTFKVTNTNDFAVENVSLEAIIPDGLTLKSSADTTASTVSLGSGESLELTLTAVKESSVITVPIGDNTEPTTQTQPVATETTENTTVVQTDSIQATTTKVNSATSDTVSTNGSDNTTIQTGKTISYLLVGLICLVCLAVAVISFRFRKKTVKYLSLVLCVCISVGSIAFVGVTNTMAEETTQKMSFEVSKTIIVDNKNYTFSANVDYEFNPYFSLTDFKADTFDIYLNEEKTVTFTCKVNSNKSIGEEDIAVYNKDSQFIVYMNDNGINGDMVANDGIYSAQATLSSTNFELIGYYATAFNCKSNIFEINFYRDLTSEEMSLFNNLHTTIADLSFLEACKYVEKSEEIDTYFIDEAHQTITYTTKYHITGIWEKEKEGSFKGSGKLSIPTTDGRDYEKAKQLIDKYYFSSKLKKKNIMVLRPFRSTEFLYDDFKYSGELLSSALNSSLVIADNGNVTISSMKMLNNYGIVLIDSHGTLVKGKAPHIVIGEKYQKNQSYSADYSSGRICVTGKKNLTIGSQFIEKYYQNKSLMNTFLFLGTCYSGYLNDIPSSLSSSGAEIVIGFTDSVSVDYCNNALFEIITNSMVLSKDTLENGVQLTKSYYGDYDPNNSNCEITMQGNISYKIIDEIKDKLFGTVKERDTNFSLSNVRVDAYLKAESGIQYVGNTYTDDKGNFSMALQGGSYELRFNKDGYKTATTTIKISKDVMTVLKDPIVLEEEITESTFKVAKDLLYVDDKYIYSGKSTIYLKENPTDKVTVLTGVGQNGHNSIGSMMSDGHTLYFTASPASLSTNCVVYSYNIDHPTLKNLFVSKGEISFLTCYDNCIYYLDNKTLNKYDLSSGKNTAFSNSDLKIDNGSHIRNASSIGQKLYLEVMNSNSKYGDYVIIEFDLNSTNAKVFLNNSSIISSHQNANEDKLYFSTLSNNDWYICSVDKSGNFTKSPKISSKLTLSQGVITYDEFALMRSDSNESDFDLYKFNLQTGNITVIKGGAGGFKNKGCGLMYDEKNREDIYISGAAKFNGNGYDATNVTGEYDPYKMWIIDGYIINRDFEWLKIN